MFRVLCPGETFYKRNATGDLSQNISKVCSSGTECVGETEFK